MEAASLLGVGWEVQHLSLLRLSKHLLEMVLLSPGRIPVTGDPHHLLDARAVGLSAGSWHHGLHHALSNTT